MTASSARSTLLLRMTRTATLCITAAVLFLGCMDDVYVGEGTENKPPTIRLTNGPHEGDTTLYQVHFYWVGYDPDGTVEFFEYVITTGDPIGFDPADTTGLDKWTATTLSDMIFKVSADEESDNITINQSPYTIYNKTHTLFVRAVDDQGMRSKSAYRSFTAFTLAPHIFIREPYVNNPGAKVDFMAPVIHFRWEGKDPLDSPWNYQEVDSVRYLHTRHSGFILERLNTNPEMYEDLWSPWIAYDEPSDSGKTTTLGDDETLEMYKSYIFAVQAKDDAGAVSSIFDASTNVRCFMVMKPTGPLITAYEPYLGIAKFVGTDSPPMVVYTPAGLPIRFSWTGDASDYGCIVSTFRYGWDIKDLADPTDWAVEPSPFHSAAPERRFYSGIHCLYIEALDNLGIPTVGKIEVNVVPLVMDRNLLWVDDFHSNDEFIQVNYMMPKESEHDAFWLEICSRVSGFSPDLDVYDTAEHFFNAPSITQMWRYKNIIWSYCAARWDFNTWRRLMQYTSEQDVGTPSSQVRYSILSYYLRSGGHLWTEGKADREGGLAASIWHLVFPIYLKCERRTGPGSGCQDTTGANYFPYRDYCVSMLDKAYGVFRQEDDMPARTIDHDAMTHAVVDTRDHITMSHPDLPEALHLWEMVTRPNMFFDPMVRGFHYVELYNPSYWMRRNDLVSQSCFHPMYRMKTRNTRSPIDNAVIAFWSTKYADVQSEAPGAVPAPSVHFGMPLWFFDRDEVHELAETIFKEWNILWEP